MNHEGAKSFFRQDLQDFLVSSFSGRGNLGDVVDYVDFLVLGLVAGGWGLGAGIIGLFGVFGEFGPFA